MSQSTPTGAATFTCFPKLPAELSHDLSCLMPGPRRVHMTFRRGLQTRLGPCTPIPTLLHLNHNGRHEALKKYKLMFGTRLCEPLVYFSLDIDVLVFGPDDRTYANSKINTQAWSCYNESGSSK
ncbi:hypothetical protein BDZ45DRAFT_734790 [Acephala macrosclerotiorum]|nr:hypothetical protein BDZ45DRAFT_734790 [Acephala macrosclerotiorum]